MKGCPCSEPGRFEKQDLILGSTRGAATDGLCTAGCELVRCSER
jgi:hypothetical protein